MGRSDGNARAAAKRRAKARTERLLRILAECSNPAQMLELYYWSREPGMIDLVRGIAAMPEEARAAFEAFVALARDPRMIRGVLSAHGELTLVSPDVSQTIALARYTTDDDAEEPTPTLN